MRLGGTFNLVLEVVALGRQELRDLKDAARTDRSVQPRCVVYRLADLEFVEAHSSSITGTWSYNQRRIAHTLAANVRLF